MKRLSKTMVRNLRRLRTAERHNARAGLPLQQGRALVRRGLARRGDRSSWHRLFMITPKGRAALAAEEEA